MSLVIIDYGMGNIGSIANMLRHISVPYSIESSNSEAIYQADGIILPGVGNFAKAMSLLDETGISEIIKEAVIVKKIPILGICLGMHLMCDSSEEGNVKGLGLIKADVVKFKFDRPSELKIPHMGWSKVKTHKEHNLVKSLDTDSRFYFVHSYFVKCKEQNDVLLSAVHGSAFTASFLKDNLFGCQFHPEKSHRFGIQLFRNFAQWCS